MGMIVIMNQKQLLEKKLRPDEIFLLTLLKKKDEDLYSSLIKDFYYVDALIRLRDKKLIKVSTSISTDTLFKDITVPKELHSLYGKPTVSQLKPKVSKWIQDYRDLYPKGMNPNGYPYRGDKKGCINNMAKFLYNYPEFDDKGLILKATGIYLEQKKKDGYAYVSMADRFIWKNDMSTLASYCEQLKEGTLKDGKRNIINL